MARASFWVGYSPLATGQQTVTHGIKELLLGLVRKPGDMGAEVLFNKNPIFFGTFLKGLVHCRKPPQPAFRRVLP